MGAVGQAADGQPGRASGLCAPQRARSGQQERRQHPGLPLPQQWQIHHRHHQLVVADADAMAPDGYPLDGTRRLELPEAQGQCGSGRRL
ncbi:hypothetical protein G6F65_021760 [Rhizopus arrhizus]|nr:hypothetical protein G6F65_021760 [Rhizopus arrhizus]